MTTEEIIAYVQKTPLNTNPNVLRGILTEFAAGDNPDLSFVTATADKILVGYDGASSTGTKVEGAYVPLDTSDATATANKILLNETAYVNGQLVTGSIESQSAQTITPTTSDQTIAAGKYLSGVQTIKGDENLIAENIAKDVTIFGVEGTLEAGGDLPQNNGVYYYDGEFTNIGDLVSSPGVGFFDASGYAIPSTEAWGFLTYAFGCSGADDYTCIPLNLYGTDIDNLAVNDSITIHGNDNKEYTLTRTV